MLTQGTQWGDHCSLERMVHMFFKGKREVKLIHRLDRDAHGLILVAHTRIIAASLSKLLKHNHIEKRYYIAAEGVIGKTGETILFSEPLDGKKALSEAIILNHCSDNRTFAEVRLHSGRKHQIRRHFSQAGHPLIGDRVYGEHCSDEELQLLACKISFICPVSGNPEVFKLPLSTVTEENLCS